MENAEEFTPQKKPPLFKHLTAAILTFLAVAFIIFALFNSFYTLKDQEQAVVTTFGVPQTVAASGIHFKIPFIQKVYKLPTAIMGFSIGYNSETGESIDDESLMITNDYNFVNVDFYIEYRIGDPVKYLYNSSSPQPILKALSMSYIRDTIGLYKVDDVITTGKNEIQAEIKEKLIKRLEAEDLGIQLVNITIQDAEPPTAEVSDAFKAVETAKQEKETAINRATKYKNEQLPAAEAKIDKILKEAEAAKNARINEANGQAARFEQLYNEYKKYPLITKQRMFYEAMEDILPDLKVVIDNGYGSTQTVILDNFLSSISQSEKQTAPQTTTEGKEKE